MCGGKKGVETREILITDGLVCGVWGGFVGSHFGVSGITSCGFSKTILWCPDIP